MHVCVSSTILLIAWQRKILIVKYFSKHRMTFAANIFALLWAR